MVQTFPICLGSEGCLRYIHGNTLLYVKYQNKITIDCPENKKDRINKINKNKK